MKKGPAATPYKLGPVCPGLPDCPECNAQVQYAKKVFERGLKIAMRGIGLPSEVNGQDAQMQLRSLQSIFSELTKQRHLIPNRAYIQAHGVDQTKLAPNVYDALMKEKAKMDEEQK